MEGEAGKGGLARGWPVWPRSKWGDGGFGRRPGPPFFRRCNLELYFFWKMLAF